MRVTSYFDVVLCSSSSQTLATPSMLARFARSGPQSHPPLKILDPPMDWPLLKALLHLVGLYTEIIEIQASYFSLPTVVAASCEVYYLVDQQ